MIYQDAQDAQDAQERESFLLSILNFYAVFKEGVLKFLAGIGWKFV
jgi:hypothetical protein